MRALPCFHFARKQVSELISKPQKSDADDRGGNGPRTRPPPRVLHVAETALYADDLAGAVEFYRNVFGFPTLVDTPRLCAFDVSGRDVLLLFQRGATLDGVETGRGFIPPHDSEGPAHLAFAITSADLDAWENRLASLGIEVDGRVQWPRGGTSLYFRDPAGHSVELVTEKSWATADPVWRTSDSMLTGQ